MTGKPVTVRYPPHPANIEAFVKALGPALAVRFLIEFAGSSIYFADDPKGKSRAEEMIGADRLRRLSRLLDTRHHEIPVPRTWLVHALTAEGKGTSEICRILKTTRTTVQKARKLSPNRSSVMPDDPATADGEAQSDLFGWDGQRFGR